MNIIIRGKIVGRADEVITIVFDVGHMDVSVVLWFVTNHG